MALLRSIPIRRVWLIRGAHILRPAKLAEWTLDTVAMSVDCPPELWKMSHDDRVVAVRLIRKRLRGPLVKLVRHLPNRRRHRARQP